MYINKCIKCGREFETKNPKRVICPDCLYPDKNMMINTPENDSDTVSQNQPENYQAPQNNDEAPRYYSAGGNEERYNRPQQSRPYNNQGGYNRPQGNYRDNRGGYNNNRQGGYNRDNRQGSYNGGGSNRDGGYNRDNRQGGYNNGGYNNNRQGGYNRDNRQGGYNRPQGGGFNRDNRFNNNNRRFNNNRRPMRGKGGPRQLLISKEQLEQIELLYKAMLPLPNPDAHEVIGEKIGLEPRKVFFGINLVRQKLMLPKLPYPKRKLAISPDQLFAIKNLYEPLLPLPPIGCHKIIAAQLKMDEWRVHVGIGLIRSQMGLNRWNSERTDIPDEMKIPRGPKAVAQENKEIKEVKAEATEISAEPKAEETVVAENSIEKEPETTATPEEIVEKVAEEVVEKPKRGRKPKKADDEQ